MALFDTVQDVFNKVWNEFVVLGRERAVNDIGDCVYRGSTVDEETGRETPDAASPVRCAIGVCLPDHLYDPEMENHGPSHIQDHWPEVYEEVFNGIDTYQLGLLQAAHDDSLDPIRVQLERAAKGLGLTIPSEAPKGA